MLKIVTRTSSLIATLTVLTSVLATGVLAAPNDAQDVRTVVGAFATTWNHHDMDAFGKLFATDADFVNVGGARWVGRGQIQLHHAYSHGTILENSLPEENPAHYAIFKHSTMNFIHIDVRFLRKDVALARVDWRLLGDVRTRNPRRGMLMFVLTRQNEAWSIAAAQNTEINRTVK
ncbi:MAG: SgcJ/EcaC family oxidoreductase [Acidobacteriota bacterium]|nr:SgcJ/EcaC family oxidoreductase [Acidobacteriota bacterium]